MKRKTTIERLAAAALCLVLMLGLAACGGKTAPEPENQEKQEEQQAAASERLRGIFEALTAPDSDYTQSKQSMAEYYPEVEYSEELGTDRFTISVKANGNEYVQDGSWEFVEDGDYLTAELRNDDFAGAMYLMIVGDAIGEYFGMEPELVTGYMNGVSILEIENDNFSATEDEASGTVSCRLNISGPWDMKELDSMVLNEEIMDSEPLTSEFVSQTGSVGRIRMIANGSVDDYTMLFAEFGGLDDVAYQSVVNMVSLRKPAGWEAFVADFTELKALETENYSVTIDPDAAVVEEMMGEKSDRFSYLLVRFGSGQPEEEEAMAFVPDADIFADFYFRVIGGVEAGTAGSQLAQAQSACDVLGFAAGNELWTADTDTLRANMLEAWNSLTDEERADFDANFQELDALLKGCFEDWEANRGTFDDAGVVEMVEELLSDETARQSWDVLSANTWTLGNADE